jgi:hypothetical protein
MQPSQTKWQFQLFEFVKKKDSMLLLLEPKADEQLLLAVPPLLGVRGIVHLFPKQLCPTHFPQICAPRAFPCLSLES